MFYTSSMGDLSARDPNIERGEQGYEEKIM